MTTTASGVRISWPDLPEPVRQWAEAVMGGPVVEHHSQAGGFSPGTADRVVTDSGFRAFVKAVSTAQNEHSPGLHRREADVVEELPVSPLISRLLGRYDDGDWVALVFADVAGRTPILPWTAVEIEAVMATLSQLATDLTPTPSHRLPRLVEDIEQPFGGWARLQEHRPAHLDPWVADHLDQLVRLAARGRSALAGDTVVHTDIRADNLLIGPDGSVTVVDWPWGSTGAAWFDRLCLVINIDLYGGHDADLLVEDHLGALPAGDITAVLAGMCGYLTDAARQPPASGLPTLRAFQAAPATSTLTWLRRRLGS